MTDDPNNTDFYETQLTHLKIVQAKISGPFHAENAEISSVAICLYRPYCVNWLKDNKDGPHLKKTL